MPRSNLGFVLINLKMCLYIAMIIALYNFNLFFQTSTKSDLQTQGVVHAESGQWMKYLGVFFPAGYLDSLSPKV